MNALPLVSIITPCLNRRHFIVQPVESVMRQDYPNIEHIIIDGGSTDGTLGVLSRYPHLRVISEPDKNLYDAINKGIELARGEIIGHLNSDDLYADNVLGEIVRLFQVYPEIDVVCAGACVFEDDSKGRDRRIVVMYKEPEYLTISVRIELFLYPIINAKFFRKSVYERMGKYDTFYSISADKEFLLRLAIKGAKTMSLAKVVYHYHHHSGSLTFGSLSPEHSLICQKENLLIAEAYLTNNNLEEEVRYILKKWHTLEAVGLFFSLIRQRRYREAASCVLRGFRYDYLWSVFLSNKLLRYVFTRLLRLW